MATKTKQIIAGRVYVLGDNIDTDLIIPAQYLNLVPTIPDEYKKLGSYALSGLPDSCEPFVKKGKFKSDYTIIVAGRNFGCGSSREHAPVCLGAAGVKAVVALSYARIFFRNCIATGDLYPLEAAEDAAPLFKNGEEAEIDVAGGEITNKTTGKVISLKPIGAVAEVIAAGGIFGYARKTGMIRKK